MLDATILSLMFLRKEPSSSVGLLSDKFDEDGSCSDAAASKCGAPGKSKLNN